MKLLISELHTFFPYFLKMENGSSCVCKIKYWNTKKYGIPEKLFVYINTEFFNIKKRKNRKKYILCEIQKYKDFTTLAPGLANDWCVFGRFAKSFHSLVILACSKTFPSTHFLNFSKQKLEPREGFQIRLFSNSSATRKSLFWSIFFL